MNYFLINIYADLFQRTKNPKWMRKIVSHMNRFWNKYPIKKKVNIDEFN